MDNTKKKLNLNQETLRNLNHDEVRRGAGLLAATFTCKCTCEFAVCTCPPPRN